MTTTEAHNDPPPRGQPGIPVDFGGGPTVDPTKNVLDLVNAAVKRQDDLRDAESSHLREVMSLRGRYDEKVSELRASYEEKLSIAESKRIDAIRAVDVGAVAVAAERAAAAAAVLANTVSAAAETQRTLVSTSASALAEALSQTIKPIVDRLASLEKAQYEGAGKSGVTDPMMTQLVAEMRATREAIAQGAGAKQGGIDARTVAFLVFGAAVSIAGIGLTVVSIAVGIVFALTR